MNNKLQVENFEEEVLDCKLNLSKKTILIIDNDMCSVLLLTEYLTETNATVIHIKNQDALNLNHYKNVDLIIKSVGQLELQTGLEIVKRIKHNFKEIPLFAHSACVDRVDIENCFCIGCNEFIPKPFHFEYLLSLLKKHLQ